MTEYSARVETIEKVPDQALSRLVQDFLDSGAAVSVKPHECKGPEAGKYIVSARFVPGSRYKASQIPSF
jgi:hypothetical protein